MRLPTRTRVHCAVHALFQQANVFGLVASFLARKALSLLISVFDEQSSERYSMEVRTTDVVRCQNSLACHLLFIYCQRRTESGAFTLSSGDIPLKCGRGDVGFLLGLLDLPHGQSRPVVGRSASPNVEKLLGLHLPPCLLAGRAPTPMPRHQLTSFF